MDSETSVLRIADAYDSRCRGLVEGYAFRTDLKTEVSADHVTKANGPFYCPACLSEAIVRKCSDKDDHFAHKALLSPTANRTNTTFHHTVRDEICQSLKTLFPDGSWVTEKDIKGKDGETFRADVAGYFGKRVPGTPAVAVEVQLSPYSPRYIRKKTAFYENNNISVLWLVPLTKRLEDTVFRPRRYELYLHSMYLGCVFYYEPKEPGCLTPVHFGPAMRYIEEQSFFSAGGVEEHVGGYYLKYKTQKTPCFNETRKVPLQELISKVLGPWENPNNNRLSLPARKIMSVAHRKWWADDENKQWLKDNDWVSYARRYLRAYEPDDESDIYPDWEDEIEE